MILTHGAHNPLPFVQVIKLMKKILAILILIFALQTPSQADDIIDFQIEGMSVGDSLLDYFSKEKIEEEKNSKYVFWYKDNKFVQLGIGFQKGFSLLKKLEIYEEMGVTIKPDDRSYKIYGISGDFLCKKDINICFSKKDEILPMLKDFFGKKVKLDTHEFKHAVDPTGNSIVYANEFKFKKTKHSVSLNIYEWSDEILAKNNWSNSMKLSIMLEEFANFLVYEAY